ncbi:MAG: flagellar motor protein MotB [Phycisphaerales bacterium]
MNEVTGCNAGNGRFGRLGRLATGVGALALGLVVLGGCKNQQHEDQMTALNAEIASLQDEKSQLAASNTALQQQLQQAQAAAQANAGKQAGNNNNTNDGGGNSGNTGGNRGPGVTIEVAGDVLFASGQATLKAEAKKELDRVASTLRSRYSGHDIRVEGYTDTDPPNKMKKVYPTNEALSQARAEAVQSYLVSKGIPSDRISAVGMGSAKPRATKAASRRVEIVVLGN